jgi:hypothetical protein
MHVRLAPLVTSVLVVAAGSVAADRGPVPAQATEEGAVSPVTLVVYSDYV